MKLIVGVTGGIGSGKTAVTDFFAAKGITIVDADVAARVVVEPGKPALTAIAEKHGADILLEDGSLNRRKLRDVIFQDDAERIWLEELLHPLIREEIILELEQSESEYAIFVSPLMIETSQKELIDRLLVVDVSIETQIARCTLRDNINREQAESIIQKQSSREEKLNAADDVVDNEGSLEALYPQLEQLHQKYLALKSNT